jgi:hypothetical protein
MVVAQATFNQTTSNSTNEDDGNNGLLSSETSNMFENVE